MAKNTDSNKDSAFQPLDLSQLKDLSFGPDWASDAGKKRAEESYRAHDGSDRQGRRDRRPPREGGGADRRPGGFAGRREGDRGPRREGGDRPAREGAPSDRPDRRERRQEEGNWASRAPFEPTVDVIFVSQDKPFELLLKAMRTTHKTYELFEIARIVLAKENRFVAIVSPKAGAEEQKLFVSVPDQLIFESREEAIQHVMTHHLERWFTVEEVEVERPAGNFQMVARCKLTGELLAPPNFHRYQDILKEHFAKNIHHMAWERFLERVETVKEPEVVQQWLDKMKKTFQYTLKQKEGDESPKVVLNALEDVKYYLTTERKNEVVVSKDKIRLPGEKIESLPKGNIRRSIERELEYQRRFPLITSNHLRGRLRRCNLNFFKKGSKGVTFVCAVKRKPRYADTVFSESIQQLIDFVESHPKILVEDLLKTYLPTGVTEITEDTQKAVLQDLRWLVGAGYVTEYGNGQLQADKALPITAAQEKAQQATAPKGDKGKDDEDATLSDDEAEGDAVAEDPAVADEAVADEPVESEVAAEITEAAVEDAPEADESIEAPVTSEPVAPAIDEPSVETEEAAEGSELTEVTEVTTSEAIDEEPTPDESEANK